MGGLRESEYGRLPIASGEGPLVNDSGILQIEWPRPLYGESATLPDLLLATVTQPTLSKDGKSYPSVEAIAQAWKTDTEGHVQYFRKNIENGIKTFQDDAFVSGCYDFSGTAAGRYRGDRLCGRLRPGDISA